MDVDIFKSVNDTYGHATGDAILKKVSSLLKSAFRSVDYVCRIGGDEFSCLIFSEGESIDVKLKNRIVQACREFNKHSGKPYYVELSIGIERFSPSLYVTVQRFASTPITAPFSSTYSNPIYILLPQVYIDQILHRGSSLWRSDFIFHSVLLCGFIVALIYCYTFCCYIANYIKVM